MDRFTLTGRVGHGAAYVRQDTSYVTYIPNPLETEADKLLEAELHNTHNRGGLIYTEQHLYSKQATEWPTSALKNTYSFDGDEGWIENNIAVVDTYEWDKAQEDKQDKIPSLASLLSNLSPQQLAIAEYLAEGISQTEIGGILGISKSTVQSHVIDMQKKLPQITISGKPLPIEIVPLSSQEAIIAKRMITENPKDIMQDMGISRGTYWRYVANIRRKGQIPEINYLDRYNISDDFTRLTDKQIEIANLLAQGYTYLEIATKLDMSVSGINYNIRQVRRKQNQNKEGNDEM